MPTCRQRYETWKARRRGEGGRQAARRRAQGRPVGWQRGGPSAPGILAEAAWCACGDARRFPDTEVRRSEGLLGRGADAGARGVGQREVLLRAGLDHAGRGALKGLPKIEKKLDRELVHTVGKNH